MDLGKLFQFKAEKYKNRYALVQGERRIKYEELYEYANKIAHSLAKSGVKKGDRILVVMKNRIETVALYWGVQLIGAVFTPVNFRFTADEVKFVLDNSGSVAVAFEGTSEDAVREATAGKNVILVGLNSKGTISLDITSYDKIDGEPYKRAELSVYDYALMLYTSGTTGRPKGVPRTHENEYSASVAHIIQNNYEEYERTIGVMPLYHTMGMRSMLSMVMLGGTIVMVPDYSPETLLKTIQEEKITCLYLVPTMYHDMLNHPQFSNFDASSLTKIGYAGAAMTKHLTQLCLDAFKPRVFVNHFGSTEVYTHTICNYLDQKPACAGKAGFNQRIRLVKLDGDVLAKPGDVVDKGEIGQVIVDTSSGESFKGYWNNEEATKLAIRDGWYFTKDIGYMDDDGDLFLLGRADDMIISGGENIHPLEVEDVLSKHPGVKEVAVVGLPDSRWGQIVTAVVVKNYEVTADELDSYFIRTSNLARFKRPRKYIFTDSLIKNSSGKIMRRMIREQIIKQNEGGQNV